MTSGASGVLSNALAPSARTAPAAGMAVGMTALAARHPAARAGSIPALKAVTLHVAPGEQVAVIGPSGAGKTTLLHAIACALRPASGAVTLDGTDAWSLSTAELQRLRGRLFLAPQVPPLPPRQRVVTAVLAGRLPGQSLLGSVRGLIYPQDPGAAAGALALFDLADKLWERVDRLSGGERQRVGLARAVASNAALWLVDEPLSALDPTRSVQAIDTLTRVARERGATLVATLHQVDVAIARFPRIIGLREGELQFDLPAAEVSRDRLTRLYAQYEAELDGPAPAASDEPGAPATSVMYCR